MSDDYDEFTAVQEDFLKYVDEISFLRPELAFEIADRIKDRPDMFFATGRTADTFLITVLQRRRAKGITTNLYIHGEGATQVGKSIAGLIIATEEDTTFTLEQVMFDFTQLDRKLPKTVTNKRYQIDDARNRLVGVGAKAEIQRVNDFIETNAEAGISLTICSPRFHEQIADIHYRIEMLGFCDEYSLGIVFGRKGKAIAWVRFSIPEELRPMILEYRALKREFREAIKQRGAGHGYVSGKVADAVLEIQEQGIAFESKQKLRRYVVLNYDNLTQRVQDALSAELIEIYFPEEPDGAVTDSIVVNEGLAFREFLLDYLPPSTIKSIIELYSVSNMSRQDVVAKELGLDSSARVSEQITKFAERQLGDLFEIWYKKGGSPAKEGEVDAFEAGIPVNLKATYSSRKKLRIPSEKMNPELQYAVQNQTMVRILAYNLYFDKLVGKEYDPQDVLKRGVAVVNFGT